MFNVCLRLSKIVICKQITVYKKGIYIYRLIVMNILKGRRKTDEITKKMSNKGKIIY